MKILLGNFAILFETVLCWLGYFLYQFGNGIKIDLDLRSHQTIIFCTIGVFFARIFLMFIEYEKKKIEIKQKVIDLELSKELLRTEKLKNDAEYDRQLSSLIKYNSSTASA